MAYGIAAVGFAKCVGEHNTYLVQCEKRAWKHKTSLTISSYATYPRNQAKLRSDHTQVKLVNSRGRPDKLKMVGCTSIPVSTMHVTN